MFPPTLSLDKDNGNQRTKLPVIGSDNGVQVNGNYTMQLGVDFPVMGRELYISNDSQSNITVTVNCVEGSISLLLLPIEILDERFPVFTRVSVQASGLWRWHVRGNLS